MVGRNFLWTYRSFIGLVMFDICYRAGNWIGQRDKVKNILDLSDEYNYEIYLVHKTWLDGTLAIRNMGLQPVVSLIITLIVMLTSAWGLHVTTRWLRWKG